MPSKIRLADSVREVWTSDDGTMAKETATTRWPKIVQDMVDDVAETTAQIQHDGTEQREGVAIQKSLKEMKDEISGNAALKTLQSDGRDDVEGYNEQVALLDECTWLSCPWLWCECYLYRRVQTIFATSTQWQAYDVFKRQKDSTFSKSRVAVQELATRYVDLSNEQFNHPTLTAPESKRLLFTEMTEIALWGNATDLSLLSHLSLEDIQSLQGRKSIESSQRNIVDNDLDEVWTHLHQQEEQQDIGALPQDPPFGRVDIVLDNSGFEFFTDLLYAAYLLDSKLASSISFHVKDIPWFVSDVTPPDLNSLLTLLASPSVFPSHRTAINALLSRLNDNFNTGAFRLCQHPFWTTGYSFHELPMLAPDLLASLQKSKLVIFKGDLNYRKLVRDGMWPHTTAFKDALGPLGAGSGLKILALRTNKADVCVGVDARKVKDLDREAPGNAWVRNGKYAVISFSDGV